MKKISVMMALLFLAGMLTTAFGEAIVTLKSGEVLHGDIVTDTNDLLRIRAFSNNRSISSLRSIPRSEVQDVRMETPAEIAERNDYLALSKFSLSPDQEQSSEFYTMWTSRLEKFLKDYPKSDKTGVVEQWIAACDAELKHVTNGEVKFGNRWMTPAEKKPLVLDRQLASLEQQRASLAMALAGARGKLAGQQSGYQALSPADKAKALPDILAFQQRIAADAESLGNLDSKIQSTKVELAEARRAIELAAAAKASQASTQAVVAQSAPPQAEPAVPAPPVAKAEPSKAQNKKLLIIVGAVIGIVLILAYPIKLLMQKLGFYEAKRDEQRRVAREKLKKVFDRIFAEGERPAGDNSPEGEVIPLGKGEDSEGGGRWFVIGDADIWAVQNNGRDTDNWVYNNVVTSGHGAVGARIQMDPELADYVRINADQAK